MANRTRWDRHSERALIMSNSLYYHVHQAVFTCTPKVLDDVLLCVAESFNLDPDCFDWGRKTYKLHAKYSNGELANVYWSDNRQDVCVEITGKGCEQLGTEVVLQMMKALEYTNVARFDLAIDGCPFTPEQVKNHLGVKRGEKVKNVRCKTHKDKFAYNENYDGQGVTIGSRSSQRYARIYDRNQDDDGNNYTRFELELKNNAATKIVHEMISNPDNLPSIFLGAVADFIDFIEVSDDKNISRIPSVSWWAEFIGSTERLKIRLSTPVVESLEKTIKHSMKYAANVLVTVNAMVSQYHISLEEAMYKYLNHGHARSKTKHKSQIEIANHYYPLPPKLTYLPSNL